METVSRVMYSIANFFTWIIVVLCVGGIVLSALSLADVFHIFGNNGLINGASIGLIVYLSIVLIVSLVTIWMVRRAKAKDSSKAWDLLFIILGFFGGNIFYILGGIFGLIAIRR